MNAFYYCSPVQNKKNSHKTQLEKNFVKTMRSLILLLPCPKEEEEEKGLSLNLRHAIFLISLSISHE